MLRETCMLFLAILLTGCVAFVNEGSEERKVNSFVISDKEVTDILDQTREKSPDKEFEINWPDKLKWPNK